jgi:hypothetical protein
MNIPYEHGKQQEIQMKAKPLVLLDMSASSGWENDERMLKFAQALNADVAVFDTELCMLPYSAKSADVPLLRRFGGGGTEISTPLRMLGNYLVESHNQYETIYVIGDLYMEAFRTEDVKNITANFIVLALSTGPIEHELKQARFYQAQLDDNLYPHAHRAKVFSFKQYVADKGIQV